MLDQVFSRSRRINLAVQEEKRFVNSYNISLPVEQNNAERSGIHTLLQLLRLAEVIA
ncbi:hypothetical protein D3C81_2316590 [compost metagenome]